jgi:hypothetical protein
MVDWQDALGKALRQIVGKPGGQCRAPAAGPRQREAAPVVRLR